MTWEIFGRLVLAVVVGAAIGIERETRDKAAGLRTMTLICLGSTLFTVASILIAEPDADPGRIAAQIVTGIGFLGAGAIVRDGMHVSGLTTAATIWLVASLGIAIGAGDAELALSATGLALVVLVAFRIVENVIDDRRQTSEYSVECPVGSADRIEAVVGESGLRPVEHNRGRDGGKAVMSWTLIGDRASHMLLRRTLFDDPDVTSMRG